MTFCLKAELVFAETRCHLIDDRAALPPWGGPLSGSGSSTSPQGVRLSPRLQYIALWRLFIERKVGHIIVGSTDAFTNEYPALPSWESQHMNLITMHTSDVSHWALWQFVRWGTSGRCQMGN